MADGGERDTAHLKQGLRSIFRRETIITVVGVVRTMFSALSGFGITRDSSHPTLTVARGPTR